MRAPLRVDVVRRFLLVGPGRRPGRPSVRLTGTIGDDAYGAENLVILSRGGKKFEIPISKIREASDSFLRDWMEG